MTLYLVPFVYLIVSAALQQLNPSLEEAARICGASPMKTLFRVTLPAIKQAIINAAIIVLIFAISFFSVPIVIGTGAGIDLLSVRIYRLLYAYPSQLDTAVSLSIFMMLFVQIALVLQVLSSRAGHHAFIAGKAHTISRVSLGRWRLLAKGAVVAYLLLVAVIPLLALIVVSFQPFWTPNIDVSMFTLRNFRHVLIQDQIIVRALINSITLGVVGATIGIALAAVLAVYSRNAGARGQTFVDSATALPSTLPHTVIAVAMIVTFSGGAFSLHGTLMLLMLAYLLISLPQAMRSARAAVDQVGNDLIEAAQIGRATQMRIFFRITFPLMLPGLIAGWVILFVYISGELTASALLSGTRNPVVGLVLLNLWENGSFPQLSAISLVMTVVGAGVVLTVMKIFRLRNAIT
jgi:iron(III) transport system permease protein